MNAVATEKTNKDFNTTPKYTPLAKIIAKVKKTGSVTDAAKLLNLSREAIYDRLKRADIDIKELIDYTNDKALSHEVLQYRLNKSLSQDDIKKMPGGSRILAICQLDDKIRLARGESTSNINVISKFIEQAHEPKS